MFPTRTSQSPTTRQRDWSRQFRWSHCKLINDNSLMCSFFFFHFLKTTFYLSFRYFWLDFLFSYFIVVLFFCWIKLSMVFLSLRTFQNKKKIYLLRARQTPFLKNPKNRIQKNRWMKLNENYFKVWWIITQKIVKDLSKSQKNPKRISKLY